MSKPNIHEFKCGKRLGSDICVRLLEEALRDAKEGKIVGLCITTIIDDGGVDSVWGGECSMVEIIGALELTKCQILDDQ